jgi:hypothetical protein
MFQQYILNINFGKYLSSQRKYQKMKKIWVLIVCVSCTGLIQAQRFFYIENNKHTDRIINDGLLKASQYITKSPLASDYIIRTDVEMKPGSNTLSLKIILEDSTTFKTVLQATEEYSFGVLHANARLGVRMAIETFINRNIDRIIVCAKEYHTDSRMQYVEPKKDKT